MKRMPEEPKRTPVPSCNLLLDQAPLGGWQKTLGQAVVVVVVVIVAVRRSSSNCRVLAIGLLEFLCGFRKQTMAAESMQSIAAVLVV